MKIGILSMQKIHNYGSFLQAMSLKMQLEARGHQVYFIDILPGRQIVSPVVQKKRSSFLSKFDKYLFKRIENYFFYMKMVKIHIRDYETYLETGKALPNREQFDLVIIGSDEVFNAVLPSPWGFTKQLFGCVENAKKVVTYAASCGSTTFESAKKYGIVPELAEAMENLSHISVRDKNTADFVEKIIHRHVCQHLDPVFISDFDAFLPKLKKRKPYLLVYAYGNRICDEKEIAAIQNYAKKNGLDVVSVGMQQRWAKYNITASAFELLSYIRGAECIVTDTFHGTVFSAKYNKRFVTLVRESNRYKLVSLLEQLQLQSRIVDGLEQFEQILSSPIAYDEVNAILEKEKQEAYCYLDMITG